MAKITSVRDILWERLERNSFLVFPEGSLDNLPHFYVFGVRTESAEETAELMKLLAKQSPNVSVFDVRSAIDTVEEVLGYISYVLGALALLVLLVALVTLLSVLAMSRNEREREVALLRTVGARSGLVARLVITEYVVLASIGALIGLVMAGLLAIPIASRLLRATYTLPFGELVLAFVALPTCVALSVWFARGQWSQASPAATLRGD
jgi:putative ABC transport system permease protein